MSERSPPDSSESRRTFLPDGRASISMPVLSRSSGSVSSRRPDPPGNSVVNSAVKCSAHVGERALEDRDDLLVDGPDHARELAAAVLHVFELLLQELVALLQRVVLLERERVDRAHEPQLAVEVAGPAGERRAFGHLGRGRVERDCGLAVVVGAEALDRGLEPQPGLGVVDLGALRHARAPRRARARARCARCAGRRAARPTRAPPPTGAAAARGSRPWSSPARVE